MTARCLALTFTLWLAACNGPFVVFPGGALSGESRSAPTDWSFAGDYGATQLETRPGEPYSVNLAYTIVDGALYINAGDTETEWVKHMEADPRVRLRIDGVIYELQSERVHDAVAIDAFSEAWTRQSMFRRDPRELERAWIYRLIPR